MTKVKDLVTVTVSNAQRTFVSAEERYELFDNLEEVFLNLFLQGRVAIPRELTSERVKMFLDNVSDSFALHAEAYVGVYVCQNQNLPEVLYDRAASVKRCISVEDHQEMVLNADLDTAVDDVLWCIWSGFRDTMRDIRNGHLVQMDMEL